MHQFYFNDCLPSNGITIIDLASLLANSIHEYDVLIRKNIEVDKGIIVEKDIENIIICGNSLKNSIQFIPKNKEERTLAFAYFTKFPIQEYLNSTEIDDTILEEDYRFENLDATNLAIAKHHNCFLFSVFTHQSVKNNTLQIIGKTKTLEIDNLYGETPNTDYMESLIRKNNSSSLSLFEQLKVELNNPFFTPAFEKAFLHERYDVQISIIEEFKRAKKRGLATPFYPDNNKIKDVTPQDSNKKAKVYELRVYSPVALRVYFCEHDNLVFIGKLGYKADYKEENSSAQSKDIKKALNEIETMIKTR
ncbi:MAG: hypothetical protein LBQ73_09260 [Tannerellaceae bacterium]|jgi:hypothetical protein|nr:hypothetical protein [Tannerellaceae bacterium]